MKLGEINVNILQRLYQVVESLSFDAASLFARFGLADLEASHPERQISIPRYMRLGEQAIRLTGRSDIGLLMGEQCHSHHFGLMGLTAQCAANLEQALSTLIQFERLTSSNSRGHSYIRAEKGKTGFCFYSISPYNRYNFFVVDAVLGGWISLLEEWSGLTLTELAACGVYAEIEFPKPSYAGAYQRWKIPVRFSGGGNTLWLPEAICLQPCSSANPITFRQLEQLCHQKLKTLLQGKSFTDRVREAIAMQLSGQTPTLRSVATALNMEYWTLHRQLSSETTTFSQLLDHTRQDLAQRYIKDTALSIGEISWLLGFSSPPAFQRAFKRWYQVTPGQYRKQAPASL